MHGRRTQQRGAYHHDVFPNSCHGVIEDLPHS